MSRFLNKKEEVIDFKLTSYGKQLLGMGKFKPIYYSFYDDNIIYDSNYFGRSEPQSAAKTRIKDETQYLEGQTLFEELEKNINRDGIAEVNFFERDILPSQEIQRKDIFRFEQALGDANLQGSANIAPAWKVVSLESSIVSSSFNDYKNNARVPQIHLTASYKIKSVGAVEYAEESFNSVNPRKFELVTDEFVDNKVLYLETADQLFYIEEMNTELLNENFEIEVFEFLEKPDGEEFSLLRRKYFDQTPPQVLNGIMMFEKHQEPFSMETDEAGDDEGASSASDIGDNAVKYYFDLLADSKINAEIACRGIEKFNKGSYYIDIDFDCSSIKADKEYSYDIYGSAVEAEICQD